MKITKGEIHPSRKDSSNLETYKDDTIALATVTQEMFLKTNTSKEYTEGFVEFIKEMRGIKCRDFCQRDY